MVRLSVDAAEDPAPAMLAPNSMPHDNGPPSHLWTSIPMLRAPCANKPQISQCHCSLDSLAWLLTSRFPAGLGCWIGRAEYRLPGVLCTVPQRNKMRAPWPNLHPCTPVPRNTNRPNGMPTKVHNLPHQLLVLRSSLWPGGPRRADFRSRHVSCAKCCREH